MRLCALLFILRIAGDVNMSQFTVKSIESQSLIRTVNAKQ